jgi:hypothetical protein
MPKPLPAASSRLLSPEVLPVAWKARLRERLVSTHRCVCEAEYKLRLLNALFQLPVSPSSEAPGSEGWMGRLRARHDVALEWLSEAEQALNSVVVLTLAAELLATHGGSADSTVRLASDEYLGQQDAVEKAAMRRLRACCTLAGTGGRSIGWCRSHTSMGSALLDSFIENSLKLAQREYNDAIKTVLSALLRAPGGGCEG